MLLAPHAVHAGRAVYTLGTNSGASPWRVGLESLSLLSAMPFALAAASAAAMGFGAEISTREEKCTLIPSHDRAWCPLPRSQTRNIPGNASLWTRITPSNATHSRERVATDLHTHAHFAQHSRERVAYLSYAMQKAARLVGRPEAYSRGQRCTPTLTGSLLLGAGIVGGTDDAGLVTQLGGHDRGLDIHVRQELFRSDGSRRRRR